MNHSLLLYQIYAVNHDGKFYQLDLVKKRYYNHEIVIIKQLNPSTYHGTLMNHT